MNVMRYTIVDRFGAMSFVAPCSVMKPLVAACCVDPVDRFALLGHAERYDEHLAGYVLSGLAVFDEHNAGGNYETIKENMESLRPHETPVFRVVDDVTRQASLQPVKAGLIVFNLIRKRIIQIQNSYSEIKRSDRGRVRMGGEPTDRYFRYKLPEDWALVP